MRTMKIAFRAFVVILLAAFMMSCEKDNQNPDGKSSLLFQAKYNVQKSAGEVNAVTALNRFMVNVAEIEIEFDDDDPEYGSKPYYEDYDLKGPFELDLLSNGNPLRVVISDDLDLPVAAYDEIEFEFKKGRKSASHLYNKSVLIEGLVDGKPFVYWTNREIELEIEFDDKIYREELDDVLLTVTFDLTGLFNPAYGGVDLSRAKDGNNNGLIEIYPDDPDGNGYLAAQILERIKNITKAFDDDDNDNDNDDSDDDDDD